MSEHPSLSHDWVGMWEAAEILGRSYQRLCRRALKGQLPGAEKHGGHYFIPRSYVEKYRREIEEQKRLAALQPERRHTLRIRLARERSLRVLALSERGRG